MDGLKIAFLPLVGLDPANTERTPKLFHLLSQSYQVIPVPVGRVDKFVFDQGGNKVSRYLVFLLNEASLVWSTLRLGKRERISAVFAEGSYYSLAGGIAAKMLGVPVIWDNHGNIKDFASTIGKSRFFVLGNLVMERYLAGISSAVLVVSEKEARAYGEMGFDTSKFRVIPTCADMDLVSSKCVPRQEARRKLGIDDRAMVVLFFGTLKYLPNRDAAEYIVRELHPRLRSKVPGTETYIAGSGQLEEDIPEGVHMLGFVPDLYLWLSAADVCVAPMWKGVGILTKVIDMLSTGRPTVVSPLAVEGIPELAHGVNCLIGKDKEAFPTEVEALLLDPARRETIGRKGKELIESSYSWQEVFPRLKALIDDLAAGPTSS